MEAIGYGHGTTFRFTCNDVRAFWGLTKVPLLWEDLVDIAIRNPHLEGPSHRLGRGSLHLVSCHTFPKDMVLAPLRPVERSSLDQQSNNRMAPPYPGAGCTNQLGNRSAQRSPWDLRQQHSIQWALGEQMGTQARSGRNKAQGIKIGGLTILATWANTRAIFLGFRWLVAVVTSSAMLIAPREIAVVLLLSRLELGARVRVRVRVRI